MKKKTVLFITAGLLMLCIAGCGQGGISSDKITELEATVTEMQDKAEIRALVDDFSNLADAKDAETQAQLFTEDAQVIISFNGQENVIDGRDAIAETFSGVLNNTEALYHMNGQVDIDVSGDSATGLVYCRVALINSNEGVRTLTDEAVWYEDEYVKENGKWLIAKRTSHFVFTDSHELAAQP